jgi:hypothetical protein
MVATTAAAEAASEMLLEAGFMTWYGDQDLGEAVQRAITAAAEAEEAHDLFVAQRFMDAGENLRRAVSGAIAREEQLREELVEMELQSVDRGQRYYRERQYRVNVAAVASRAMLRAHAESHTGPVKSCETCAADWAVVQEASGITAPGN